MISFGVALAGIVIGAAIVAWEWSQREYSSQPVTESRTITR